MPKKIGQNETVDPTDLTMSDAAERGYQPETRITPTLSSIRVLNDGNLTIGGFTLTRRGLQIQAGVKPEDWNKVGGIIQDLGKSIQWILGDWLAYGVDRKYGVTYEQVSDATGYEIQSLQDLVYVCKNVQFSVRTENLKFGHHKLVAGLRLDDDQTPDVERQHYWLEKAVAANWSISQMRDAMKSDPPTLAIITAGNKKLDKAYSTILQVFDSSTDVNEKRRQIGILEETLEEMRRRMR